MKSIYKLLLIVLLFGGISACEQTDLDLQDNPNAVTPDKADPNFLLNNILISFNDFQIGLWGITSGLARMTALGNSYQSSITPPSFNGTWTTVYANLFPDIDALVSLTSQRGNLNIHSGAAKILKAYVMMTMVDMFGDVPYEEAGKGIEIISPKADSGQSIYDKALILLDEAIAELDGTTSPKPTSDFYYAGDAGKWISLANTLKMRTYLQTRLVDTGAGGKFKKILEEGNYINAIGKDFQFPYGNNRVNPNSRHPFYNDSYEASDGTYMSNYYMWEMAESKGVRDPRIRFYFYRQVEQYDLTDVSLYSCIYSSVPDSNAVPPHFKAINPKMPYCVATYDGYYGRDHGNAQGIPPDGPLRAVYGLYPGGGKFDDNSFKFTQNNGIDGAKGQGINPIMLATYVDFMRAEAALTMGTGEDARALLESGIRKSFEKVLSFVPKGDFSRQIGTNANGDPIFADAFIPDNDQITDYVNLVLGKYDVADNDGKLDMIVREYFFALWGNGIEAYNTMRRTCKPTKLQPNVNALTDPFPRSFVYPQNHVDRNANAQQKPNLAQPVFWDTNPAGCLY
jgi:hypothetical protein